MVFSKKGLFLFFLISLSVSVLFAQTAQSNTQSSETQVSSQINESEISLNMPDTGTTGLFQTETRKKSSVWPFIKMILLLVVVLLAVYGFLFYMKRRGKGTRSDDQFLRRVAFLNLGQGKSVEVVTLVDHGAYLLGVTEGGINLISEVKDPELIQAMNLYADKQTNSSKPKNFADVLDMFMPGGPREPAERRTTENVFASGEQEMDQLFQAGTSRLNEKE